MLVHILLSGVLIIPDTVIPPCHEAKLFIIVSLSLHQSFFPSKLSNDKTCSSPKYFRQIKRHGSLLKECVAGENVGDACKRITMLQVGDILKAIREHGQAKDSKHLSMARLLAIIQNLGEF